MFREQLDYAEAGDNAGISFEEGFDKVSPGDKVDVTVEFITPVAMEVGTQFSIREGGRTVAKGLVTEVLE